MNDTIRPIRSITYLSFATEPKCLGVVVLPGSLDPLVAINRAAILGINPGGEVLTMTCSEADPDVTLAEFEVMWSNRERLIPPEEARKLFQAQTIAEIEEQGVRV